MNLIRKIGLFSLILVMQGCGSCSDSALRHDEEVSPGDIMGRNDEKSVGQENVMAVLEEFKLASEAKAAFKDAGIASTVDGYDEVTVLIPTNKAFQQLKQEKGEAFMKGLDEDGLKELLNNHIIKGKYSGADLANVNQVESVYGNTFPVKVDQQGINFGGARVLYADIAMKNGYAHIVDQVFLP